MIPRPPLPGESPTHAQRWVWGAIAPVVLVVAIAVAYAKVSVLAGVLLSAAVIVVWIGYRRWARRSLL